MHKRTAHTGMMKINSVSYSSSCEIGDVNYFTPMSEIISVQKEGTTFSDEGYELSDYSIFQQNAVKHPHDSMSISQRSFHHVPKINVGTVAILGVSTSSIMQIGGIREIDAEARVKHIRILKDERNDISSI